MKVSQSALPWALVKVFVSEPELGQSEREEGLLLAEEVQSLLERVCGRETGW